MTEYTPAQQQAFCFGFFDASKMTDMQQIRVMEFIHVGHSWQDAVTEINFPPHNIGAERQKLIGRGLSPVEFTEAAKLIRRAGLTADEAVALAEKKRI